MTAQFNPQRTLTLSSSPPAVVKDPGRSPPVAAVARNKFHIQNPSSSELTRTVQGTRIRVTAEVISELCAVTASSNIPLHGWRPTVHDDALLRHDTNLQSPLLPCLAYSLSLRTECP